MRKIKKTLLTCLIAIFAFTLCLGTGLLVKTNTAKADAVSVTFVSAGFDGGADIHETYGNPIRINTTELAWATSHNWVSASDWASISDYVTINGRTITEINNATTSSQKITLMMQGAGTFSFLRCYVPSDVMAIADVKSVGILEGWSFTDDQNGNVVYTASAVSFFRTGDTLLTKSDYDAQVTSKTKVLASDITISDATLTKPDDSYVVNVDMGVDMSGISYEVMGDGCINIRNAIYINGKSINEWNNQLIAEDSRFSDTATYCKFPQNSTTEGHEKFHRPVAIYGTSTGFTIRIFQELVADCETVTVTVGEGCYYSSFMVLENASKIVLDQNVVDITDKLTFLDNSHNNPADWGPTKLYFINTDNETCWTGAPWGGCLNESDTSGANGGQVQMKYIYFNGTSLWEINKTDDGSYSSTQGNIASGGVYAPILVTMSSELGSSLKLHVPDAYTNGKSGHEEIIIKKGFNVVEGGTSYVVTSDVIFTNTGSGWVKEIKNEEVATEITAVNVSGSDGDNFTFLTLSVHDYPDSADNYGETDVVVTVKDFINDANFYSKILIDDSPLASRSQALINVWGNKGVFAFRTNTGLAATKITILAGCKFPSYAMLADGTRKCFVTTEDVTFVKSGDTWAVEVEAPFDLETYKAEMIAEISAYKQGEVDESERLEYVSSGTELIADSETKEEVDEYVALVKEMIDELPVVVSHTVTFKHEDGSVISSTKVEENATVAQPVAPTKAHANMFKEYRFDGWFVNGAQYDFNAPVTSDLEIIAKFTEVDKQAEVINTAVVMAKPVLGGETDVNDYFLAFELSVNDYAGLHTYPSAAEHVNVIGPRDFLKQSNFTQKVLVNDAAYPVKGETFLNVWSTSNSFTTRANDGEIGFRPATLITKITILAGCQFPTYEMLSTGVLKYYVTTEDITFVVKNGEWMTESEALKNRVRFVNEDGTVISEQTLEGASAVARPADPVKTSVFNVYSFDGWFVDGVEFDFDTVIDRDIDITAKFAVTAKEVEQITSTVETVQYAVDINNNKDFFLLIGVAGNDYAGLNTYPSAAEHVHVWTARQFVEESNFYSHVEINGVAMKERGEVFINVWGKNGFSIRTSADATIDGNLAHENVTSIKFLAGCQFPTYRALREGVIEVLTVLDDVTFTLVDGNWVREEFRVNGAPIELDAYKANAFREAEKAERDQIVADAKAYLESATTAQQIEEIVANAKAAIDELKTEIEYIDEELAPIKNEATAEIQNYKADEVSYDVQKTARDEAVANGLAAIASARNEDEIFEAVADAQAAIDAVINRYQVVESTMLAYVANCYALGGNINLHVAVPELDLPEGGTKWYATDTIGKAEFEEMMTAFGIFDKIMLGDKTLREWGFTSFFTDNQGQAGGPEYLTGYNMSSPTPSMYIQLHTDSQEFKDEFDRGNINLEGNGDMVKVTIKEGLIIPGNAFLTGADVATLYVSNAQSETAGEAGRSYNFESVIYTDIDSIKYVQGHDGVCGYLGVSLIGDDYATTSEQVDLIGLENIGINFAGVTVNDEEFTTVNEEVKRVVAPYGLFNLGEAGKGYYSFQIFFAEEDVHTITIPAGTAFPTYAIKALGNHNRDGENPILIYFVYKTTKDVTFVKTADGFKEIEAYRAELIAQIDDDHAAKDGVYFESDVTAMAEAVAAAKDAIANAENGAEMTEAYAAVKAVLDAVLPKADVITVAKEEISAYKADEGLFLEAEKAARETAVATAISAIDGAQSKAAVEEAVATAKATIDALKTAETYAKEAIAEDVAAAKAELTAYKAEEGLYREAEVLARATIVETAIAGLDDALNLDTVNAIVAAAKAEIDALKTDAEYDAEEALVAAKEAGMDEINTLKGNVDPDKYTDREMATINQLYNTAKTAIEDATTIEAVEQAVATFTDELNKLPQIGQGGETSEPEGEKPSGGCGGAIGGAGAMLTVLLLAGAMLLKKKND